MKRKPYRIGSRPWVSLAEACMLACVLAAMTLPAGPALGAAGGADAAPAEGPETTIVYYFHGTVRCPTCLSIESNAREVVFERFFSELKQGEMEWRSVNFDVPEYKHYEREYGLEHPLIVLVRQRAGYPVAHVKLDKTWKLSHEPDEFKSYVRDELKRFHEARNTSTDSGQEK